MSARIWSALRGLLFVAVLSVGGHPQVALAQSVDVGVDRQAAAAQSRASSEHSGAQSLRAAIEAAPDPIAVQFPPAPIAPAREPRRPAMLAPLYGSFIGLQALDIHSTRIGISSGRAREGNPVMRGFAGNSAGLIAVKAAATAGVIYGTEKLWKRNRVAAIVAMVALNSATAVVVGRNYRITH